LGFVWSLVIWCVKFVICGILGALNLLWLVQDWILYYPTAHSDDPLKRKRQIKYNPPVFTSPTIFDPDLNYEDVWIRCKDDIYIHSWFILQPEPIRNDAPTFLYFHGNAGNIGFRLHGARDLYKTLKVNILMVEYRGYGNSEGTPSQPGLMMDADCSLDYLLKRKDINSNKIFVFGRSLGGAVSFSLVKRQNDIAGFIIENTFTNLREMALIIGNRLGIPYLDVVKKFLNGFMVSPWKSDVYATELRKPILFISGSEDELIPQKQMKELFQVCSSREKSFYEVVGGNHNSTWQIGGYAYLQRIQQFLLKTCD